MTYLVLSAETIKITNCKMSNIQTKLELQRDLSPNFDSCFEFFLKVI